MAKNATIVSAKVTRKPNEDYLIWEKDFNKDNTLERLRDIVAYDLYKDRWAEPRYISIDLGNFTAGFWADRYMILNKNFNRREKYSQLAPEVKAALFEKFKELVDINYQYLPAAFKDQEMND